MGERIRCEGKETSIMDCPSNYNEVTGVSLASCSHSGRPAAILCEQGYVQLGDNMMTSTRKAYPRYIEQHALRNNDNGDNGDNF